MSAGALTPDEGLQDGEDGEDGEDSEGIEGLVEGVDGPYLHGWAWNARAPGEPLRLDVYVGGHVVATVRADRERPDLALAGKGDGRHGFFLVLPAPPLGRPVRVMLAGTDIELLSRLANAATDIPLPPLEMIRTVGLGSEQEFIEAGHGTLHTCRTLGQLRPKGRVLDVGCGVGRLAIPLTQYLFEDGSYDGLDVIREMIDWTRANISSRYPNFRFQHLDVHNAYYNPGGTTLASEYRFPFADDVFTLAFLGSVFTHLLPPEMERYLSEIARVLRPGGRCLISVFVLEGGVLKRPEGKSSLLDFQRVGPGYRTSFTVPEQGVAYEESDLRALYARCGLHIVEPIQWGAQDLIVAFKPLVAAGASRYPAAP